MSLLHDVFRGSLMQQHKWWDEVVGSLTLDQFHLRPNDQGNSVAFSAWHYARTEDNVVQFVFRDRTPTVWVDGGYDVKFGLHRAAQGTGMPAEDAAAMRFPSVEEWMAHQQSVWNATMTWLDAASDADLSRIVKFNPFGEVTIAWTTRQTLINHGFLHLGEVYHVRTMMGLVNPELPDTGTNG